MSYNGTVTCSHCYRQGHNKSGCPELKKAFEVYKQKLAKHPLVCKKKDETDLGAGRGSRSLSQKGT